MALKIIFSFAVAGIALGFLAAIWKPGLSNPLGNEWEYQSMGRMFMAGAYSGLLQPDETLLKVFHTHFKSGELSKNKNIITGAVNWFPKEESLHPSILHSLTTLQKQILIDSIIEGKDFKETLKQIGVRKTKHMYGLLNSDDNASSILVRVKGRNYEKNKPRLFCEIVGISVASDKRHVLMNTGFTSSDVGFPWEDSVQIREFETDSEAEKFGEKLVTEFHVKD